MWQRCFLLILSVTITGSLSASLNMVVSPKITVSRGEDTVLRCFFTHSRQQDYLGLISVKWLARNAQPFFSCSAINDSTNGPNDCSSPSLRFSLHGDPRRGELSLLIRKVQLTDNGAYFCRVELDSSWTGSQKETQLHVTAKPQILSLSVVETPSDRKLQCEVEGHPPPKIVWLSVSRRLLENQAQTSDSGPYRRLCSVLYLEEEVLTCRVESALGEAERTYPADHTLVITLTMCGLVLLLLLLVSGGVAVYCRTKRGKPQILNLSLGETPLAQTVPPQRLQSELEGPHCLCPAGVQMLY